jgi:FkbM family methyltransferase
MKRFRYKLKQWLSWVLVPIWRGPLQGYRIGLFTGSRFVRGTYGGDEADMLARLIKPGDVVFDVGAHVGYYSMLASHIVGRGRVFSFEPLPLNLKYLNQHVRANRLSNVEVIAAAVGRAEGWLSFDTGPGTGRGRLNAANESTMRVRVHSIDELLRAGRLPRPNFIKMDIEGAEVDALRGAAGALRDCRPTILLSTHGREVRLECESLLRELGYRLQPFGHSDLIATPAEMVQTEAA